MKKILCFFLVLILLVLGNTLYIKFNAEKVLDEDYKDESLFDIYITKASNEVNLIQIESINNNNIKYYKNENINKKYENASLLYIDKDSEGKIYIPYSKDTEGNTSKTKRVLVFDKGNLENEIEFNDIRNPQNIISDIENEKIYVEQSITTQSSDSPGLKLKIIDTKSLEIIGEILLKGYIGGYYIGEDEIILSLEGANKLGFVDYQDRSLYAINRKTSEGRVLTKDSIPNSVNAICQDTNGNNIIFSNLNLNGDIETEKNEVVVLNKDGVIQARDEVPFDMINNFYGNERYEYILNGKYPYENNGFIIFNKEELKFEKFIDDIKNIAYIEQVDKYIFILTVNSKLYIYDDSSLNQIGSINLGEDRSYKMKVVKRF